MVNFITLIIATLDQFKSVFIKILGNIISQQEVRVTIEDDNDHKPDLVKDSLVLAVSEDTAPGDTIGEIAVTDEDARADFQFSFKGLVLNFLLNNSSKKANWSPENLKCANSVGYFFSNL